MPFWKENKFKLRSRILEDSAKKNGLHHAFFASARGGSNRYIGEWFNDIKTGKGGYFSCSHRLYEGDFERNLRHGYGVFAVQDNNKKFRLEYRGDWVDGHRTGQGERCYSDGSVYVGGFLNNKRHGYGRMWYADGSYYDGNWWKDIRQGLGLFVQTNGNRYEGYWKANMKHGKGRFFHLDSGQMQDGVWREDICVVSSLEDILFRQTVQSPTEFYIPKNEVIDFMELLLNVEEKVLWSEDGSCIYSKDSMQ